MSARVDDGTAVRRAAPIAEVDAADRVVLLRLDDPTCAPHVLRGTAIAIWHAIDDLSTPEEISRALAEAYEAPQEAVHADVTAYLAALGDAGLIEVPAHSGR